MFFNKYGSFVLSIFIGIVFVFSAITKLFPIELLEFSIVETGFFNWKIAAVLARIIIAFEFFLGILLIINVKKALSLKLSIAFLLGFTVYLFYVLILDGNKSNCNCFGMTLVFTPLESIFKNILMLIVSFLALYKIKETKNKFQNLIFISGIIVCISAIFIMYPVNFFQTDFSSKEQGEILQLQKIYDDPELDKPEFDIKQGKWIVFFASSNCTHCVVGAYKIHVISKKIENLNIYFFINGDDDEIESFHKLTKTHDFPYMKLPAGPMIYYSKGKLPAIYLINNQIIEFKPNYIQLDENLITDWLNLID